MTLGAGMATSEIVHTAHPAAGESNIKAGYDPRLTNEDLAPLRDQHWGTYNIFAFWMSDVHSVGGYVTAGSLFALGLNSWQVLVSRGVGITIVYFFRKFIDFCGPAVYVVMFCLLGYLINKAGWSHISLNIGTVSKTGWSAVSVMLGAIALVVSYFSGPMLNFGDFARYGKSFSSVKKGNFLGLPLNFLMFSLLVVFTASLTIPVYGKLITDPVDTVARIDSTFAIVLGALTFTIATMGINIVANFISPAFDFSHVSPQRISWRMGG